MHELSVEDVQESFVRYSEAERDFRVAEVELLGRLLDRDSIATRTAVVFGKLLAYLTASNAYDHNDALFIEQAFLGQEKKGAARVMAENLHRTIDRASALEEEFRLERITYRVLLMVEGAGAETTV